MGNTQISEYNGVNCGICGKALPPCRDWDGFVLQTIDRKVDVVEAYVYLSGRYYRIKGYGTYYCPEDFWKPKNEYLQKLEEETRQREEQERRRWEELARQQEEEQQSELQWQQQEEQRRQLQEQQKQEELRRQEEAGREAERQAVTDELEQNSRERFEDYTVGKDQLDANVSGGTYRPVLADSFQTSEYEEKYYERMLREDVELSPNSETVSEKLHSDIVYSLSLLTTEDKELDNAWLRSAQIVILTRYLQANQFSKFDKESVLDF